MCTFPGSSGSPIHLTANYFRILSRPQWVLYQYHVDYKPPMESRRLRSALLFQHEEALGSARSFDGALLFLPHRLHSKVVSYKMNTHNNFYKLLEKNSRLIRWLRVNSDHSIEIASLEPHAIKVKIIAVQGVPIPITIYLSLVTWVEGPIVTIKPFFSSFLIPIPWLWASADTGTNPSTSPLFKRKYIFI